MINPSRIRSATRLAQIIDLEGRKQTWLAQVAGIDPGELSKIVSGRYVLHAGDSKRDRIARALGRTPDDVFAEPFSEAELLELTEGAAA